MAEESTTPPNPPPPENQQPGNQPPTQQGYPPPGYVPPGYPLPGYPGYPPPGYVPPGYPGYPPGYLPPGAVPVMAVPVVPVPPAQGSLWQAWVAVGTRPSRQNFAAWAQITSTSWMTISYVVATLITAASLAGLSYIFYNYEEYQLAGLSTSGATITLPNFLWFLLGYGGLGALIFLITSLGLPLGMAIMTPKIMGNLRQRYVRVLRPWALGLVPLAALEFIAYAIIAAIDSVLIRSLGVPSPYHFNPLSLVFSASFILILPVTAYSYIIQLQSGSVGTNMERWKVFLINLATSFIMAILFYILVFIAIIAIIAIVAATSSR